MGRLEIKRTVKRLLPNTLFGRSLLIIVTPVLLLQIIVSFIFFDRHWSSMSRRLAWAMAGDVNFIVSEIERAPNQAEIERIIDSASSNLGLRVSLEKSDKPAVPVKKPLLPMRWYSVERTLDNALQEKLRHPFTSRAHAEGQWYEIIVEAKRGDIRILASERRLFSSTTYIFILWMLGSSFVLFTISIVFMRNQIRPIHRLALAAERFGRGEDTPAFKPEGATEVRRAAVAFVEMRDRLRRQIEQRTAMLSGVSHDLRTPLTRMRLQLEMLGNTPDIADLRRDVDEMESMIEGYLSFARGESGEQSERVDLKEILSRIAAKARRQGFHINENYSGDLHVRLRPQAIERALGNLVSNASKYAPHVWVSAYKQSKAIEITVDDDGPGIKESARETVFRPFYRVEASRNKKTGGIGLGLSIAQDIIHAHGGEIWLEDSNHGGLRVVVRLPL